MVSGPSCNSVLGSVTVSYFSSCTNVAARSCTCDLTAAGASPAMVWKAWASGSAAAAELPGVAVVHASSCDLALATSLQNEPPAWLDAVPVVDVARAAEVVVTFEDHVITGGYGASVLELLSEKRIGTPVIRIAWPDQFIEHATTVEYLREKHGLTAGNAVAQVKALLAPAAAQVPQIGNVIRAA